MTTLGEVLVRLQDRTELCRMLAESGDLLLISRLDKLAEETGTDVCDAALDAVEAFTTGADDEAWVKLIGRVQNSDLPASAFLGEIIAWSLQQ